MSDVPEFSALVGDIYDAALDSSLWPAVLQKISGFVPGRNANIFIQDANNRFANSIFTWGVDPAYFQSYLQTYAKLNPCFPAGFFVDVGEVFFRSTTSYPASNSSARAFGGNGRCRRVSATVPARFWRNRQPAARF
jgi:hypothetical protein